MKDILVLLSILTSLYSLYSNNGDNLSPIMVSEPLLARDVSIYSSMAYSSQHTPSLTSLPPVEDVDHHEQPSKLHHFIISLDYHFIHSNNQLLGHHFEKYMDQITGSVAETSNLSDYSSHYVLIALFDLLESQLSRENSTTEKSVYRIDRNVERYFSEGRLNVTFRLMVLFSFLEREPKDGTIDSKELETWMMQQMIDQLHSMTQKELQFYDKNGDKVISFAEYLPQFSPANIATWRVTDLGKQTRSRKLEKVIGKGKVIPVQVDFNVGGAPPDSRTIPTLFQINFHF